MTAKMRVRQMVAHCCEAKMNRIFTERKSHLSLVPADALDLHRWNGQRCEVFGLGS